MKLGVRAKLFLVSLSLIAAAVVVADVYLTTTLDRQLTERIRDDLLARAALTAQAAGTVSKDPRGPAAWDVLADQLGQSAKARVTLVDRNGRVLGDSDVAAAEIHTLDNHASRPEISDALESGNGWSVRYSTTVRQRLMYVAVPFRSGETVLGIARVAQPLSDVDRAIFELRKSIAVASLIALAVAILMSIVAADLTSRALRRLTEAARRMAGGDLGTRTRVAGHDEIAALGEALDRLAENLSRTLGELRSERDLLDGILSGMQEGVLVTGGDGRIILVNPALREMLLLPAECTGKSVLQAIRNADLVALLERAAAGAAPPADLEVGGLKPRRLLVHAVTLSGVPGGVLAVFVDVTELRRLEAVRRDFVANASHELRTPVAAVRAAAETLRSSVNEPEAALRFTAMIERNAERLERLIEDLLELSRIESRQFQLNLESVDLGSTAQRAIALHRAGAAQKRIDIGAELEPDTLAVRADRRALELVFGNLLDNAVKYSGEGAHVRIRGTRDAALVRVSVTDTGPGIEPQHLARLFERFYRVDPGRSRELGGTGLGLAIVKHLVEAMGGTVSVESTVGAGTTFTFTLLPA